MCVQKYVIKTVLWNDYLQTENILSLYALERITGEKNEWFYKIGPS
jgi:hypothetical protein